MADYEAATAAAVQPDGKIVVVGRTSDNDDGAVWRLLPDGAPDLAFGGGDGFVAVDSGADEMLADVAIAPDGAIVVVGRTTVRGQATIYRLTSSGDPDAERSTRTARWASGTPAALPPPWLCSRTAGSSLPATSPRQTAWWSDG